MDTAEAIAAITAVATLALPILAIMGAGARRLMAMRPRVPSSRFGGIVILCASLGGIGRASSAIAAVAPITARAVPVAAPPKEATPPGGYIVQPGDSLWAIASRYLESGGTAPTDAVVDGMWRSIYAANRQVVGEDPDLIYPGTRLTIPEEHT